MAVLHEPATLTANNPKQARQRAPSTNPKGIASSSPRLRGTSYLGSRFTNGNQPQRGCGQNRSIGVATNLPQPRWGCSHFATFTQGRRRCANLGLWAAAPLGLATAHQDGCSGENKGGETFRRCCVNPRRWPRTIPSLRGIAWYRSIPKGLCPPAQGCEERATLGHRSQMESTPTGL